MAGPEQGQQEQRTVVGLGVIWEVELTKSDDRMDVGLRMSRAVPKFWLGIGWTVVPSLRWRSQGQKLILGG